MKKLPNHSKEKRLILPNEPLKQDFMVCLKSLTCYFLYLSVINT